MARAGRFARAELTALMPDYGKEKGPCPAPPAPCDADLDCNGSVGATDLLILLTNWGPNCGAGVGGGPPQDILDCIDRFCCEPEDMLALQKCICLVDPECDPSP